MAFSASKSYVLSSISKAKLHSTPKPSRCFLTLPMDTPDCMRPQTTPLKKITAGFVILNSKNRNRVHQNTPNDVLFDKLLKIMFASALRVLAWSQCCHRSVLTRRSGSLRPRWRDWCPEICLFRRDFVFCINNFRISKLFSDSQIRWKWWFWFLRSRGCNPRSMKVTLSLSRRSTNPAWDSCRNASF